MTPKEKARELCEVFREKFRGKIDTDDDMDYCIKESALIAVNELLKINSLTWYPCEVDFRIYGFHEYWELVKIQIQKL